MENEENRASLDAKEAAALAAATRLGAGRLGGQGANVAQGSGSGIGRGRNGAAMSGGSGAMTTLIVIVILVGVVGLMIALGR